MMTARYIRSGHAAACAALLALVLAACGGDPALDGFGTGDTPGGSGGGIGGSGIIAQDQSIGTIDGFGSILLNGQRLDVDTATVRINGRDGSVDELAVGMRVRADVDFDTLTASRIEYAASLAGTLESVDLPGGRLVILGRPVLLTATTLFDGVAATSLLAGQALEISGVENASGDIVATLIRPPADPAFALFGGVVDAADTGNASFTAAGQRFDTAGADLSAFQNGFPSPGERVLVFLPAGVSPGGGADIAAVRVIPTDDATLTSGSLLEISGVVTAYTSVSAFSVNGIAVATRNDTVVELVNGIPFDRSRIGLNARVEVEGVIDQNGVLHADRLIVMPGENSEILGVVENVDTAAGRFVVLGVTVQTSSNTRYKSDDDRTLSLQSLVAGDYVDVKAAFEGNQLLASLVEREERETEAELQGPVTAVNSQQGTLSVLGQAITLGPDTEYEISDDVETSRTNFLDALTIGDVIKVKWEDFSQISQPPDSIEIENSSE